MLSRHTKRALLGFTFAAIILVVTGAAIRHYFAARALEIRLEQERAELVPPEPMLANVERMDRFRERSFAVRLQPDRRASVAAEVSGRVVEIAVDVGDVVEEGEVLLRLDPTLARLGLESARAAVDAGEAQLREFQRRAREADRLRETAAIPETQAEEARAQAEVQERELDRLRSELRRQEELLARHEIRAPFAGHVNQRLVETGDSVNVNQGLFSLVTLDPLRIRFYVSDLELGSFRSGEELRLTLTAFPGETFQAAVASVGRAADPSNGLFLIEAKAPNADGRLPAGAQGRIRTVITRYADALFVPASAVRFEGRRALVEIWADGEGVLRELELGREVDGFYPVLSGISEGETLIVR